MALKIRPQGCAGDRPMNEGRKDVPGRRNHLCRDPGQGELGVLRKRGEVSVWSWRAPGGGQQMGSAGNRAARKKLFPTKGSEVFPVGECYELHFTATPGCSAGCRLL